MTIWLSYGLAGLRGIDLPCELPFKHLYQTLLIQGEETKGPGGEGPAKASCPARFPRFFSCRIVVE